MQHFFFFVVVILIIITIVAVATSGNNSGESFEGSNGGGINYSLRITPAHIGNSSAYLLEGKKSQDWPVSAKVLPNTTYNLQIGPGYNLNIRSDSSGSIKFGDFGAFRGMPLSLTGPSSYDVITVVFCCS